MWVLSPALTKSINYYITVAVAVARQQLQHLVAYSRNGGDGGFDEVCAMNYKREDESAITIGRMTPFIMRNITINNCN